MAIPFVQNDGGRADAGFKGQTGDCSTRAIAIATGKPYREVYDALTALAKTKRRSKRHPNGHGAARTGVSRNVIRQYMESIGWHWTPTMQIGSGCTVHLRADQLPSGRLVCSVSRHLAAVIDGVLHDTFDCSRDGARCVYGYWSLPD